MKRILFVFLITVFGIVMDIPPTDAQVDNSDSMAAFVAQADIYAARLDKGVTDFISSPSRRGVDRAVQDVEEVDFFIAIMTVPNDSTAQSLHDSLQTWSSNLLKKPFEKSICCLKSY